MRNLKQKLVLLVLLMITSLGFGKTKDNFEGSITILNDTKLKLVFDDVKKGQFLNLYDESNNMLYSEKIDKEGELIKILDLSFLKNGDYKIELEKDFKVLINKIKIKDNQVILNSNSNETVFKPLIRNDQELLLISKIAFDEKPLNVFIYYEDEMIYSETLNDDTLINRVYRLNKELVGNYRVILTCNDRDYSYDFNI